MTTERVLDERAHVAMIEENLRNARNAHSKCQLAHCDDEGATFDCQDWGKS